MKDIVCISQAAASKVAEAERAPLQATSEEANRKLAAAEREKRQLQEQLDKLIASATSGLPVEGVHICQKMWRAARQLSGCN